MRRLVFPLILGIAGCAILIALAVWQMQRLEWKRDTLAMIEARIAAAPVDLPVTPDPVNDRYLAVTVSGVIGGSGVMVFAPVEGLGIGYRAVAVMISGERAFLVDLGFVDHADFAVPMGEGVTVTGNLAWPDELTGSTPPPDSTTGIWYARDVTGISTLLGTEPLLVVARDIEGYDPGTTPVPVSTATIRNNHLEYAITWSLLAVVWAAMSGYLMWRTARRKD